MYEKEKETLRSIVSKKGDGVGIYERVREEVYYWDKQRIKRVHKELQREYEIGVPIDRVHEELTLYASVFSLIISGLVFAFGEGYSEGIIVVVGICILFALLLTIVIAFTRLSYRRKRELKTLIDILDELC